MFKNKKTPLGFTILLLSIALCMGILVCHAFGENTPVYSITVNKATNCVTVYQGDEPVKAFICSVGKNGSTPSGTFKTSDKYQWRALYGNVYGQYATRITGHILFHSVYYKSQNKNTLQYGEYNKLGTAASAGCIRLAVKDCKWIYDNCPSGTTVRIINSGTDPLPRPKSIMLTEKSKYPTWDPTDPDPNNPWANEAPSIEISEYEKEREASPLMDLGEVLHEGVVAYDTCGNVMHYDISCNIPKDVPGKYEVKYFCTDTLGRSAEKTSYLILK